MEFLRFSRTIPHASGETPCFRPVTLVRGGNSGSRGHLLAVLVAKTKKLAYTIGLTYFFSGLLVQGLKITFRIPRPWVLDPDFQAVPSAVPGATGLLFSQRTHPERNSPLRFPGSFFLENLAEIPLCPALSRHRIFPDVSGMPHPSGRAHRHGALLALLSPGIPVPLPAAGQFRAKRTDFLPAHRLCSFSSIIYCMAVRPRNSVPGSRGGLREGIRRRARLRPWILSGEPVDPFFHRQSQPAFASPPRTAGRAGSPGRTETTPGSFPHGRSCTLFPGSALDPGSLPLPLLQKRRQNNFTKRRLPQKKL